MALMSCTFNSNVKRVEGKFIMATVGINDDPVLEYTQQELSSFLNRGLPYKNGDHINRPDIIYDTDGIERIDFSFVVNKELPEAAFAVDSKREEDKLIVKLSGHTASDVLYAAYTFLEKGGFLFEITGPIYPKHFNWQALEDYKETIIAAVKKRGIRQHINFPMDLSAWSLSEAKEYISNLSRMRFNYMTFHSYPGQWYEVKRDDDTLYAGHFFYGDVHPVPDYRPIKNIAVNKKFYCIPEIEPYFEDEAKRSELAVKWLQSVITEAKRTGMQVQFSFEPRDMGTKINKSVETVKAIINQYPMIDALEFITEEAGGWGARTTKSNTQKVIAEHFGSDYLNDSVVMKPVRAEQSDLAYVYGQVGHSAKLVKYIKENSIVPEHISLKLGIYVVIPEYARPAFYLARKSLPKTEISLMPGHHSVRVKSNSAKSIVTTDDWDHSVIYSWIEFDGMMYIQQNGISGIQSIVKQAVENTTEHRANAILYNHWRTAENRVTARYAAVSGLYGAVEPEEFYKQYAKAHGIVNSDMFSKAMKDLDDADLTSMKQIGGIGFCWVGRWRNGGNMSGYSVDKLQTVQNAYEKVLDDLKQCSGEIESEEGRNLISFLDNRIRTTIVYTKVFEKSHELASFNTKKELDENGKQEYVRICNESLALLEQYIDIYASDNADRGCSGNLVSLWYGPVKAIKFLREKHGGVPFDDDVPEGTAVDAPPLPMINTEK